MTWEGHTTQCLCSLKVLHPVSYAISLALQSQRAALCLHFSLLGRLWLYPQGNRFFPLLFLSWILLVIGFEIQF